MTPEEQAAHDRAEQERLAAEKASKETNDKSDDTGSEGGDKKEVMIPKTRFDQVNEAKKEAEAKLKAFEEAEAKRAEEEKLAQGKFEELLNVEKEKNKELLSYKDKYESLNKKDEDQANKELEDLKSSLGEEKFGEFSKIVSLEGLSGREKIEKIQASKGLFGATKKEIPNNPGIPGGNSTTEGTKRYVELAQKKGRTPQENAEFIALAKELGKF